MTFELEANGIRFSCSSPVGTRKLVEKGARLVDESQAEDLRRVVESAEAVEGPTPESQAKPRHGRARR